jgi:hypothetical protein
MSWLSKLVYGVELDEEQARSNAADAQLDQLNQQEIAKGRYDAAVQKQIEDNATKPTSNYHADVSGQVNDEFAAGAREGFNNTVGVVAGAVKDGALGLARGVPWWFWVGLILVAFLYLGGLDLIRRRVARR